MDPRDDTEYHIHISSRHWYDKSTTSFYSTTAIATSFASVFKHISTKSMIHLVRGSWFDVL